MTNEEELACEVMILSLLRGFPSSASAVSRGLIDSYIATLSAYSLKAVKLACDQYRHHRVDGHDYSFAPSAPAIAHLAGMYDSIENPAPGEKLVIYPIGAPVPEGHVPLGPIEVDFGHGKINLRGMTHAQKMEVYRLKRLPTPSEEAAQQIGFVPKFQRA